jgi:pyruvate formate-lyase activating enzyme-like uncharacterized protein
MARYRNRNTERHLIAKAIEDERYKRANSIPRGCGGCMLGLLLVIWLVDLCS